jgi:hypothetical protein
MTKIEAIDRFNHLRRVGEKHGLIVEGWLKDRDRHYITDFAAGEIGMVPDPAGAEAENHRIRIIVLFTAAGIKNERSM